MDFWNAISFGGAVADAVGSNASQKAALQLMAMQPGVAPRKNEAAGVEIEMDPEAAAALEILERFSENG